MASLILESFDDAGRHQVRTELDGDDLEVDLGEHVVEVVLFVKGGAQPRHQHVAWKTETPKLY